MSYSVKADILEQLDEAELIRLTDPDGAAVDDDVVARAIEDADATIDAYCQGRYTIPLSPVPDKIRQVSVDIAIYNLFSRRGDTAPETRKDRHKDAIRFLEKVAEGKLDLGIQPPPDAPDEDNYSGHSLVSSRKKIFGPDTLDKY
jgi:phage gp36-like protein